jgi:hypothetical protein
MTTTIRQSNDSGIPRTSWSDIVARGQLAKVPTALQRQDRHSVIYPTETVTLYEDENLGDQLRAQRPASIIQQALHPDTVLFTFAANIFKDRTEVIKPSKRNWRSQRLQTHQHVWQPATPGIDH